MRPYPKPDVTTPEDMLRFIARERDNDVQDFNNLPQLLVSGRKVGKVPTDSADVDPTDRLNDINWDESYIYVLIDNAGTPEWRRASLASW